MTFSFLSDTFAQAVEIFHNFYETKKVDQSFLDPWTKEVIKNLESIYLLDSSIRKEFEDKCLLTKKYNGFNLTPIFLEKLNLSDREKLERSILCIYVYYKERNFREGITNPGMLQPFFNFIEDNKSNFQSNLNYFFSFVDQIPFLIMSEIYSNKNFQKLVNITQAENFVEKIDSITRIDEVINTLDKWESNFSQKHQVVQDLEERLEKNKQTYDFVLLNAGFKNLYVQKKVDLKNPERNYKWLFRIILLIPIIEILFFGYLIANEISINSTTIWYMVIPSISLILFMLYFYRINLQEVRSVKSQMMQLELRMALCQFIYSYAEDSEKLHKKNSSGFEKFENIIFSPLVSSDDKIPTTFDGMEQLAKLIGEFRRN